MNVFTHKTKGGHYAITHKVQLFIGGHWRPAVVYQNLDMTDGENIVLLPEKFCMAVLHFDKKHKLVGKVEVKEVPGPREVPKPREDQTPEPIEKKDR